MHYYFNSRPVRDFGITSADVLTHVRREDSGFGPFVTALRKARSLTRVQLADAGTTPRSISYCESDDGVPPSSLVTFLAQAVQVSADELRGLTPAPKKAQAIALDAEPETPRHWKRFQMTTVLPKKGQRAAVGPQSHGSQEDYDGR